MTGDVFGEYGEYFDLLYGDKDYDGETDYLVGLLKRFGVTSGSMLELGSGTGRHGRRLAKAGFDVLGIERSEAMIGLSDAAGTIPGFSCQAGDIRDVRLDRTFDVVTALFHVLSYQVTTTDLLSVFRNARSHLTSDGLFVFDFWYGPAVHFLKPTVREKKMEGETLLVTRTSQPQWDQQRNLVDVHFDIEVQNKTSGAVLSKFSEVHRMRYFSLPELDVIAECTGFRREVAEEFQSGAAPSEQTWGVCMALRAQ
jgi:SAM-dependent methyltransferase